MMKRLFCFLILSFFAACFSAESQVSLIMNGSFEKTYDVDNELLTYWCDMNTLDDKFQIYLNESWFTHDVGGPGRSLVIRAAFGVDYMTGDTASISQQVYLEEDVEGISFDLDIGSVGSAWNHNNISVLVLIDGVAIWDSQQLPLSGGAFTGMVDMDANDIAQYIGDMNDVNQLFDNSWHDLSLAMRSNVNVFNLYQYTARWDFVKFNNYCGGFGFLPGDLSQDCYVNLADFAVLGLSWMSVPARAKDDLNDDGIVDNNDLRLFAGGWLDNTDWRNRGQAGNTEMGLLENDFDLSGQIDLGDLMIFCEHWLGDSECDWPDLSGDDVINFEDFAVFAQQWGWRDWLYYVE
jgi:hypothetical protein